MTVTSREPAKLKTMNYPEALAATVKWFQTYITTTEATPESLIEAWRIYRDYASIKVEIAKTSDRKTNLIYLTWCKLAAEKRLAHMQGKQVTFPIKTLVLIQNYLSGQLLALIHMQIHRVAN